MASIIVPEAGQPVGSCVTVRGTAAQLPPGKSLVSVKHTPGADYYVESVWGWESPANLATWRVDQFFNDADGQRFTIGLYLVDLEWINNQDQTQAPALRALPSDWSRLAEVAVVVDGDVPSDCRP